MKDFEQYGKAWGWTEQVSYRGETLSVVSPFSGAIHEHEYWADANDSVRVHVEGRVSRVEL